MDALLAVIAIAFVVLVLMVVVSALFEMNPFATHENRFHKPGQGQPAARLTADHYAHPRLYRRAARGHPHREA